jgi:RNA polymerase sigma-70 factor, ECF subfamily
VDAALETDEDDPFATVAQAIEAERVQAVLRELPEEQREAIVLAYFAGLTHQEIAEETGAPLGTVKSRMRLGLRRMRTLLGGDEGADAGC